MQHFIIGMILTLFCLISGFGECRAEAPDVQIDFRVDGRDGARSSISDGTRTSLRDDTRTSISDDIRTSISDSSQASISDDTRFIRHLMEQQFWGDAIFAIETLEQEAGNREVSPDLRDSLHFWAGWSAYNRQELPSAIHRLQQVSETHPSHSQAAFYTFYLRTYLAAGEQESRAISESMQKLEETPFTREIERELRHFQLAGMALLKRDFETYKSHSRAFTGDYFAMAEQQDNLERYRRELRNAEGKSPFLAAAMSAVIPGSGKIYAGRRGSGISTFFQVAVFGGLLAESYYRAGPRHPRTWVAGSAFGLFYVSNIWGSAVSVRITREEIYEQVDQRILFDLHIPLRSIFR